MVRVELAVEPLGGVIGFDEKPVEMPVGAD
jgi:hypothetical protein